MMASAAAAWRRRGVSGDPYWDYVVSLINFIGEDDSTDFVDHKGALELSSVDGARILDGALYLPNVNGADVEAYVESQAPAPPEFGTGSEPMCMEFSFSSRSQASYWPRSGDSYQCILSNDGSGAAQTNGFDLMNFGSGFRLRWLRANNVGAAGQIFPEKVMLPGEWHHVALTFDGSIIRLYLDGQMEGSVSNSQGWVRPTNRPFVFGRRFNPQYSNNRTYLLGSIRGFRLTRGVQRYEGNFTPPVGPLPVGP